MFTCGYCDLLVDLDYVCGEWNIKDRDGNIYDFVCEDCVSDDEVFDLDEAL